jgi:hypothetical protein
MVDLDTLRASISELSELVDALETIPDANAMTLAQAISLSQRLGRALAAVVYAGSNAVQDLGETATLYGNARRPPTGGRIVEPRRRLA